jgi:hypothetical protein
LHRDSGCDLAQDPHLGQGEGAGLGNNEGLGPLQLGNEVGGVEEVEGDEEEAGRVVDLTGVKREGEIGAETSENGLLMVWAPS